jgi:hypothetical protein
MFDALTLEMRTSLLAQQHSPELKPILAPDVVRCGLVLGSFTRSNDFVHRLMCELRDELLSAEEEAKSEKEEISSDERQSKGLGLHFTF